MRFVSPLPFIDREADFAPKGYPAINLVQRNFPLLLVDVDLACRQVRCTSLPLAMPTGVARLPEQGSATADQML
ncbi:hypothetical protein [Sphingobium mellinum]|uniref:hypothetical protein n=1 Tax=Sphingobium mellinum TaxID=1387166 RepID=UPI0030EC1908